MDPYDMIKGHLGQAVPFANHVGVEITVVADGRAEARLDQRRETQNHIEGQHAGAMFTLGEAASGAAVAGALAPVILDMRPVAATAEIKYLKFAQGTLTATATTSRPGAELMQAIQTEGKVAFGVVVDIRNEAGESVVGMSVDWYVSPLRK